MPRATIYRLVKTGKRGLVKIGELTTGIAIKKIHAMIDRNKALP
ncbi:hypothetical protein [Herbaspirillum sp. RV1423]|nr:hypothetical protein [Herbaspirillum sp. RV1423]